MMTPATLLALIRASEKKSTTNARIAWNPRTAQ